MSILIPKKPVLLFLHVHKTGGTTLRSIIDKQYLADQRLFIYGKEESMKNSTFSEKELRNIHCIYGHFPYGIHRSIQQPFTYITMIRNPIARVISLYNHIIYHKMDPIHQEVKNLSLLEYAAANKVEFNNSNLQTSLISGEQNPDLEKAKENIRKHFSVVGITERFDESIYLMKKRMGWNDITYVKKNQTIDRLHEMKKRIGKKYITYSMKNISNKIIEQISSRNELDIQLYHYASKLLDEQIKK